MTPNDPKRTKNSVNARLAIASISIALALLLVASLPLFNSDVSHRIVGSLYLLAGVSVVACAKWVPQQQIGLPTFLQPLLALRPMTLALWGSGIVILGFVLLVGLGEAA